MVHVLFEQTNTFRDIFRSKCIDAISYDIAYGADVQIDLFDEIKKHLSGTDTIFSKINKDELVIAFFPCTYFSVQQQLNFTGTSFNLKDLTKIEIVQNSKKLIKKLDLYYTRLMQLIQIAFIRDFKLIVENPYHCNFLNNYMPKVYNDKIIFKDRRLYSDLMKKPTVFYFFNCESKFCLINYKKILSNKTINSYRSGIERSKINKDFAEMFINNFIL